HAARLAAWLRSASGRGRQSSSQELGEGTGQGERCGGLRILAHGRWTTSPPCVRRHGDKLAKSWTGSVAQGLLAKCGMPREGSHGGDDGGSSGPSSDPGVKTWES